MASVVASRSRKPLTATGLHLAQVLALAMHEGSAAPARGYPEAEYLKHRELEQARSRLWTAACTGAGAILAGGLLV
jgi:hypothetical protein